MIGEGVIFSGRFRERAEGGDGSPQAAIAGDAESGHPAQLVGAGEVLEVFEDPVKCV
jgi:hypothetical protein